MSNRYIVSYSLALIGTGLALLFLLHMDQALNDFEKFETTWFYRGYEIKFLATAILMFITFLISTFNIQKAKNQYRWTGWLGMFGPLGIIVLLLMKTRQPFQEEPEEEEELPELPQEPQEETMEVNTIQVRTPDGRIIHLRTVDEVPDDLKDGGELTVADKEAGDSPSQENENDQEQEKHPDEGKNDPTNKAAGTGAIDTTADNSGETDTSSDNQQPDKDTEQPKQGKWKKR